MSTTTIKRTYKTFVDRLVAGGLDVIRPASGPLAALSALSFAPKGDLLNHPRQFWPIDRDLVDSIKDQIKQQIALGSSAALVGVKEDLILFEEELCEVDAKGEPKRALRIVGGARRCNHAIVAEQELRDEGVIGEGVVTRVPFRLFPGTKAEAVAEMLEDNSKTLKLEDAPSVLAVLAIRLVVLGVSVADITKKMPRDVGLDVVMALTQWHKLLPEVAARFDSGEAKIGFLPVVVAADPSEQMALVDRLLGARVTTSKGASRTIRKDKAQSSGGTGERLHPRRSARLIETLSASKPKEGSPAYWILKGMLLVEGKLDISELPSDVRAQLLSVLPATVHVTAN